MYTSTLLVPEILPCRLNLQPLLLLFFKACPLDLLDDPSLLVFELGGRQWGQILVLFFGAIGRATLLVPLLE